MSFSTQEIMELRKDFPGLHQHVYNKPLVYLDNAATSQKPTCVIEKIKQAYTFECANIHRGVHKLSQIATKEFENTRKKVQRFIGAESERNIVFTSGTTEAINLVAHSYGALALQPNDRILISTLEHHANIVPWQLVCEQKKVHLDVVPIHDDGTLDMQAYERLLTPQTKLIAITHISNALGIINDVHALCAIAKKNHVPILIDGAQAVPHTRINVQELDCDFYVFSGHKMYAPDGIGVLYAKSKWLQAMPPYQSGGDMIATVSFEKTTFAEYPSKFEAGTPNIVGAIALGTAIDYIESIGLERIQQYEHQLLHYATEQLQSLPYVRIIGTSKHKAPVISFLIEDIHPHDIGTILDREGIAIRTGHHCAQPIMQRFNIAATARASFAFYNTQEEVDALVKAIQSVRKVFGYV